MGNIADKVNTTYNKIFNSKKEINVILLGLDYVGKTTILNKLIESDSNEKDDKNDTNKVVMHIPTIGFNVEKLTVNNFSINCWDVGGADRIRPLWRHYYQSTDAIIYVVDCNDHERFNETKDQFNYLLPEEDLKNKPILVFANKQDLNNAASPNEIVELLNLNEITDRKWKIQGSSGINNIGLSEGFEWLAKCFDKE